MRKFQIENTKSGADLGIYEAENEQGAIDAMRRDAGFLDQQHVAEVLGENPGRDLSVTEIK